jgi:hypothetical protein
LVALRQVSEPSAEVPSLRDSVECAGVPGTYVPGFPVSRLRRWGWKWSEGCSNEATVCWLDCGLLDGRVGSSGLRGPDPGLTSRAFLCRAFGAGVGMGQRLFEWSYGLLDGLQLVGMACGWLGWTTVGRDGTMVVGRNCDLTGLGLWLLDECGLVELRFRRPSRDRRGDLRD